MAHSPLVRPAFADSVAPSSKKRNRRKRFLNFVLLESSAIALLILLLVAGTSQWFAQPGLTRAFLIGIVAMASVVAIIPVIFYGLPRQRYRYSRRRDR